MNEPAKRKDTPEDLTQKAYREIRRLMFYNDIVPGQKLSYRDLAKRLNMSPTPVTSALKYLEFQGLVRKEMNRGYFTEPISLKEVQEIYDFREVIEISLLPKAIEAMDKKGERALRAAYDESVDMVPGAFIRERVAKDVNFHMTLAGLSANQTQIRALHHLFDLLYLKYGGNILFNQYMPAEGFETHITSTDSCHELIIESVLERSVSKAESALKQHIRTVRDDVLVGLERMIEDKSSSMF